MKLVTTLCAVALFCAPAVAVAQETPVTNATITSGKIKTKIQLRSARISGGPIQIDAKEKDGTAKKVELKDKDLILGLEIQSAEVAGGQVTGSARWPASVALNVSRGTVVATSLSGMLNVATLKKVEVAAGTQTITFEGRSIQVTFPKGPIELTHVEAQKVVIEDPELPTAAAAQAAKPSGKPEDVSLVGDYLKFRVRVPGFAPQGSATPGTLAAPANSCFRVSREFEAPDPADVTKTKKFVTGKFELVRSFSLQDFAKLPGLPPYDCATDLGEVNAGESYDVLLETLANTDRDRYGWTWGVLIVPFKYYRAPRDFSIGATVGPYVGYRMNDRPGGSIVFGVALGGTSTTVKDGNNSAQRNGISGALTLIFDIKAVFNVGVAIGEDHFSRSDSVPISGKTWYSVSIGRKLD